MRKLGSDGAVVRSTLVIKDVAEEDFGAYGCKVANAFGSTSAVILLRKQSKSIRQSNNQQATISVTVSLFSYVSGSCLPLSLPLLSGDLLSSTPFRV